MLHTPRGGCVGLHGRSDTGNGMVPRDVGCRSALRFAGGTAPKRLEAMTVWERVVSLAKIELQ